MAKFLAIDWDETECRYAAATLQNEKITISHAGTVPIVQTDDTEFDTPLDTLALALRSHFREERIGSSPLLISLGRHEVEWLQQKLPPCKESEIPSILKNQVLREISGSTEADLLDYLLLESSSEGHRVLGLSLSQTFRKSLFRTFRSLGYPPMRIGFRAANACELVIQHWALVGGESAEPKLVVNVVGNDVDLIMIVAKRITAIRSFRLPAEHQQKNLADEIDRTLTIGLEGDKPLPIQHVILFDDGTNTEFKDFLSKSGLTVQFLNPFTLPNVSAPQGVDAPAKFAPLIGSLLIQSKKSKPVIDFLQPKEAPKPPNYARPVLLALVLLGVVCFGLYYWNDTIVHGMREEFAKIKEDHEKVVTELQKLMPSWNVLYQTHAWESQNVVWLDVLRDLSIVLPSDTDLVVSQMTFTGPINSQPVNNRPIAGSITLSGMVRDPSVLMKLQSDLHATGRYLMQNPAPSPNPAGGGYPWLFRTTIYHLR